MSVVDQIFSFLTDVYNGLSGVFFSAFPFNVLFVLGLVFSVFTVAISIVHVFGSVNGRGRAGFHIFRGSYSGIKGPNLVSRAGRFNFRSRGRSRRKVKKKIGQQVNYITNIYDGDGEKIDTKISSHE